MTFRELHYQNQPLLLSNVWDVPSTKISEKLNYKAIGTSSSAIASLLGYKDGENISFEELFHVVTRIKESTHLPLSVDMEAGYASSTDEIIKNIERLASLGVAGINLEDSKVREERILLNTNDFANKIFQLKNAIRSLKIDIFINIRTDTFILNAPNVLDATKERIRRYEEAGADGIFIPGIVQENDIREITQITDLPINVMCMPGLPHFNELRKLGVKRISMGNFIFDKMYDGFVAMSSRIQNEQSFNSIF